MLWLLLAVLFWGLIHSLLASLPAKELVRRQLGDWGKGFFRLGYNLFACVSFLPVLIIAAFTPDRRLYLVPLPWAGLMVLGELSAVFVMLIAFRQAGVWDFLGLRQAIVPGEKRQGKLVTSGLFHYVRHPLYSAGLAFIWLLPLMTDNVLAINIGLTVYVVVGAYFEERKMRPEFGMEYTDYAAGIPMFIPFLKGNKAHPQAS